MKKRTTHHVVDDQEVMRFNLRRKNENGKTYSLEEFKALLHKMGYNTSGNFIKCCVSGENPPFIRMERGKYCFSPKPVHILRLQKVWDDYGSIGKNRAVKDNNTVSIEQAIKVLKDAGYKVLKPVTQYEEV